MYNTFKAKGITWGEKDVVGNYIELKDESSPLGYKHCIYQNGEFYEIRHSSLRWGTTIYDEKCIEIFEGDKVVVNLDREQWEGIVVWSRHDAGWVVRNEKDGFNYDLIGDFRVIIQ